MRSANIRRDGYLKFLNTWQNRDVIKVLSGVRRSGKSTLLAMFQQDLKAQGVQAENIIALNSGILKIIRSSNNYPIVICMPCIRTVVSLIRLP